MSDNLLSFWNENKHLAIPFDWLSGRSFSESFVICLGAGPWKIGRRKKIQGEALEKIGKTDLSFINPETLQFPLAWQNDFLTKAIKNLQWKESSFEDFCKSLAGKDFALKEINSLVETPGAKVISLFCRDSLKAPSFPIDRHVKRKLQELRLPTKEVEMIKLSQKLGLDPCQVAVAMVRSASSMDNPDWSIKC